MISDALRLAPWTSAHDAADDARHAAPTRHDASGNAPKHAAHATW